jgi:sarcosine oxidase subunit alpha
MPEKLSVTINGVRIKVDRGTTVANAALVAGQACRTSISGRPRGPLCGMGICFECRVTINGELHCRSCQMMCESGMDIRTDVS